MGVVPDSSQDGNTRVYEVTPPPSDNEDDDSECDEYKADSDKPDAALPRDKRREKHQTNTDSDFLYSSDFESNDLTDDNAVVEEEDSSDGPDQNGILWDRLCTTWLLLNNMQTLDLNGLNTALLEEDDILKMRENCEDLLHDMGATVNDLGLLAWPNLNVERFILAHDLLCAVVNWTTGPFCDFYTQPDCSLESLCALAKFLTTCGLCMYAHHNAISGKVVVSLTRRMCVRIGSASFQDSRPQFCLLSPQ